MAPDGDQALTASEGITEIHEAAGEEFSKGRLNRWLSTFVDSIFWWKGDVNTSSTQTASEVGTRELNVLRSMHWHDLACF